MAGTEEEPITIRAYPGERIVIDGGIPECQTAPATAWQPLADSARSEYVSRQTFRNIRDVVGSFGDRQMEEHFLVVAVRRPEGGVEGIFGLGRLPIDELAADRVLSGQTADRFGACQGLYGQ